MANIAMEAKLDFTAEEINTLLRRMANIYPVGSVYISMDNIDPSTLFGGTWTKIESRFLLASGTYNIASGETWTFEADRAITADDDIHMGGKIQHTHTDGTLAASIDMYTTDKRSVRGLGVMGMERVAIDTSGSNVNNRNRFLDDVTENDTSTTDDDTYLLNVKTDKEASGGYGAKVHGVTDAQTSLPPYIVVNMWYRAA